MNENSQRRVVVNLSKSASLRGDSFRSSRRREDEVVVVVAVAAVVVIQLLLLVVVVAVVQVVLVGRLANATPRKLPTTTVVG